MPRTDDDFDQRGLIQESYRIDGIGLPECKSIFLDWAISVPVDVDSLEWVRRLLDKHAAQNPGHPMTQVLTEALNTPSPTRRRGGAKARRGA